MVKLEQITALVLAAGLAIPSYWFFWTLAGGGGYDRRGEQTQPINSNSSLDNVEIEDQDVVLEVQKGIKSKAYNSGRYSPKFERGLHHFHLLLQKYLTNIIA